MYSLKSVESRFYSSSHFLSHAATLDVVEDAALLFHRSHELKHNCYHLYFSPLTWFSGFYGLYESLDRDWHRQYLVVTSHSPNSWGILDIPLLGLPWTDKPSYKLLELETWEENVLHDLLVEYPKDHEMMMPLLLSEEVLSFSELKPGTPWIPSMGK